MIAELGTRAVRAAALAAALAAGACAEETVLREACKTVDPSGLSTCPADSYCGANGQCVACPHVLPMSPEPSCAYICTGPAASDREYICMSNDNGEPDARCDAGDPNVCAQWIEVAWVDGRLVGVECFEFGEIGIPTGTKACALGVCLPTGGGIFEEYGKDVDPMVLAARPECTCTMSGPEGAMACDDRIEERTDDNEPADDSAAE